MYQDIVINRNFEYPNDGNMSNLQYLQSGLQESIPFFFVYPAN